LAESEPASYPGISSRREIVRSGGTTTNAEHKPRRAGSRIRPPLSAVLVIVNLAVILLPLGSIFFFRIYENQLVQETERELISQAALIGAAFEAELARTGAGAPPPSGRRAGWTPVDPRLDLARVETLPARSEGRPPAAPPTAAAVAAGKALTPVLDRAQLTTLIGARVLDAQGTAVGGTAEIGLNFAHVPEVAAALSGRYASALRYRELENAPSILARITRGTGVRVFVAMPVAGPVEAGGRVLGAVYLSRTPKSILRHLYDERENALLAAVTMLVLSASLALLTSRTISRPVAELLARTRRVTRGETAAIAPLERPGTREMAELGQGIALMAAALNRRAEYIRTLANHVSHEFKTPIAAIQGAAELLQDHEMTADERRRFAGNIAADGARLKALLDRLMELAKAENTVRSDARAALRPAAEKAAARLPAGVAARVEVPEGLQARIAEDALAIVLGNLLENAAQHGATEVRITAVRVTAVPVTAGVEGGVEGGAVVLTVADDGRGVSAANRQRIFDHFFTTRRDQGGTGLGLGIVRALLAAHGGTIELAEAAAPGTAFRLTLRG
jgi:signal transduction histidine kinase